MTQEDYLGIDWSEGKHELCLLNPVGEAIVRKEITHSLAGFGEIEKWREQLQLRASEMVIGIESANSLLIDWLWEQGYEALYVTAPHTVEKSRDRFHPSGAKDDRLDANEIAELVWKERSRLLPWHPGSRLLQQMRVQVSFGLYLTKNTVALSNRLRSLLVRYYPAALATFTSWPTYLVCHLVMTYPDPRQVATLTYEQFRAFARGHGYPQPKRLLACYDRLQAAYPTARAAVIEAFAPQAVTLAEMLLTALRKKEENLRHLNACFVQHPDAPLFASFPGAGDLLAPALLVKFGEDRTRFPRANLLQTLAGTAPVTAKSGKRHTVFFRRACDHRFRYIVQQWAHHSRRQSDWAAAYYQTVFQRSGRQQHATRCLANRWLAIAWRCWQDGQPYDEAIHLQRRRQRRLPKSR
jgi:transposase